jgi:predicted Zn-dependent protease
VRRTIWGAVIVVSTLCRAQNVTDSDIAKLQQLFGSGGQVQGFATELLDRAASQPGALLAVGQVLGSHKEFQLAEQAFARAASLDPASFAAQFNLGLTLYQEQKLADAIGPLTAAVRLQPSSFQANYLLGVVLSQSGRKTDAIRRLRTAGSIDPQHIGVMTMLGVLYLDGGYSLDAAEVLDRGRERDPSNEKIQLLLVQARHQNFDFEGALALARSAAAQFPKSPDAQFRLGYELETAGRFEEAEKAFHRALALEPRYAGGHVALGRLSLRFGRAADAIAELEAALRDDAKNPEARLELSKARIATREFSRAQVILQELIRESPEDPALHALLARVYSAQGESALSASERERHLALNGQAHRAGGMSGNVTSSKPRRFEP